MATQTVARIAYQSRPMEELLARTCGCGALAWYSTPTGRIACAECGVWFR